jgi:TetR/AcrR family transcriptional regulator, repressor of fatR-cypB operon
MVSQKREDILLAALALVSRHGFHGTSMSMIAAEADVGAGTIYNYFPSKDELMRALFVQIKQEFVEYILDGIDPGMALEQQFYSMWRNVLHYYIQYPERMAYSQQFHHSPYFDQACLEQVNALMSPIADPFESAMTTGLLKNFPRPVLETFTLDAADALARRHTNGEIQLDEALITQTARMCWAAIRNDGEPQLGE